MRYFQALKIGRKVCYSGGDIVLYACLLGFHERRNKNLTFQISYCLGAGIWSLPIPMNCISRSCRDDPPNFHQSTWKINGKMQ